MRIAIPFTLLLLTLPACGLAALDALEADLDARETEGSTTSGGSADTGGSTTSTVTTSPTAGSEGDTATGGDTDGPTSEASTTPVDPEGPPAITDHELDPSTLFFSGALNPKVWAEGADGVRMNLDGAEVELTRNLETDAFEGQIVAYSALQNGDDYVATFTPWRDDGGVIEGEALELPYTIAFIHEPGDEDLWDLDKSGGSGQVSAIGVLPEGDAVELVTLVGNGTSKCILRRRDSSGVLIDVVDLIPNVKCKGLDLEVDDTGAVYLLLDGWTNAGWMWWLTKAPYFGATLKTMKYGGKDEVAHALAVSPAGTVAVCGSTPTPEPDDLSDAIVHIIRPGFSDFSKAFDHVGNNDLKHSHDERARGCAFDPSDEERLVVVGEVFGRLDTWDNVKRNRSFDVVYDVETNHGDLRVASAGLGATQSFASDVAFGEGHAFVLGHVCGNDACDQVEGKIWALDGDGDLTSTRSLGLHSNEALHPSRVRVSPAGYLVVTSGGLAGSEEAFLVRAYDPFKAEPLFTFVRQDAGLFHLAHALAIGTYGQIYAGGFGADGYPLFVVIYG